VAKQYRDLHAIAYADARQTSRRHFSSGRAVYDGLKLTESHIGPDYVRNASAAAGRRRPDRDAARHW